VVATRDAETDALTGLRNHRSFQTDLREALALGASTRSLMGLVLIDIDNFKSINDRFGHQVGDDVLITLARLMREEYGDAQAYRIGGEEFALLLPDDGEQEAYTAVERLHARLWQTKFPHGEPVTVSAGIASYPGSAGDRDQLCESPTAPSTGPRTTARTVLRLQPDRGAHLHARRAGRVGERHAA
jgi:diguanylate cyclase (GGDEF) domain